MSTTQQFARDVAALSIRIDQSVCAADGAPPYAVQFTDPDGETIVPLEVFHDPRAAATYAANVRTMFAAWIEYAMSVAGGEVDG